MTDSLPFSQEVLNEIFKLSSADPDRLISRESSTVEFKESFGWKSLPKYLKTCAAYANTRGGYIVFGVANKPHRLIGLSGTARQLFETIDPAQLSGHFADYFAPEIHWQIQEYELDKKIYGLLYISESCEKPVVCKKDVDKDLKEGDIYYRYRGRSERIKYSELRSILEAKRENEQRLWMQHLATIARIGVREAAVFDLKSGKVTGTGGAFFIDESLLSQLSFIKEGEFSEVKGKPTLRLIGNLEAAGLSLGLTTGKQIIKTKGIRVGDIVGTFLNHGTISDPHEFIKQICFESTAFLPVYYFMQASSLKADGVIELLNSVISREQAKSKLIERLKNGTTQALPLPKSEGAVTKKKQAYASQLLKKSVDVSIDGKELEYCLQAMRGLSAKEIQRHSGYLRGLLRIWFNKYYASAYGPLADNLRRAICWVDEALYMKVAEGKS